MYSGCVLFSAYRVFCCQTANTQSHIVHPNMSKYARHHAQLPSLAFSFPTNHKIPWLFYTFPVNHIQQFLCNSKIQKSHKERLFGDYTCKVLPPMFLTGEESAHHLKCHFQQMINQCHLRFKPLRTRNKSTVPTSDS